AGSVLTSSPYCPEPLVICVPSDPLCAAVAATDTAPVPWGPFQAFNVPDSKSSEKTEVVYTVGTAAGMTDGEPLESGPVPDLLMAATANVYAVPSLNPGTYSSGSAEFVNSAFCAVPSRYGVTR